MDKKEEDMGRKHSFLKLLTATGIALLAANKYVEKKAKDKNKVHTTGSYFKYKYGDVNYNVYGEGLPLILIHDLDPMASSYEWEEIIDTLSENYTVYVLDLLGCGQSDKPNITYTNYMYVDMLHHFMDEVVGEKATLLTSHNAAGIGFMCNHMYPESIEKIIAINPNDLDEVTFETTQKDKLRKSILYMPIIGTAIYNANYTEEKIRNVLRETYFNNAENVSKYFDLYYQLAHHKESKSRYLYASIACKYTNINIENGIKDKDNIIIIQSNNRFRKDRIESAYSEINPKIKSLSIDNSKLLPQLEVPEKLASIILEILK